MYPLDEVHTLINTLYYYANECQQTRRGSDGPRKKQENDFLEKINPTRVRWREGVTRSSTAESYSVLVNCKRRSIQPETQN